MSRTTCEYKGRIQSIDGTVYACVVAVALSEGIVGTRDEATMRELGKRLETLRFRVNRWRPSIIGGDLEELMINGQEGESAFKELLSRAESKLQSFGQSVPNTYLRELLGDRQDFVLMRDGDFEVEIFLNGIKTLRGLLAGDDQV